MYGITMEELEAMGAEKRARLGVEGMSNAA
jgi:hypothetical protein